MPERFSKLGKAYLPQLQRTISATDGATALTAKTTLFQAKVGILLVVRKVYAFDSKCKPRVFAKVSVASERIWVKSINHFKCSFLLQHALLY